MIGRLVMAAALFLGLQGTAHAQFCLLDSMCDDGNPCTDDQCGANARCAHRANTAPCDDGRFCNGADRCRKGSCEEHEGDPCDGGTECADSCDEERDSCFDSSDTRCSGDGNPCTADRCDGLGTCGHLPLTGRSCDDGLFCNGEDRCVLGVCRHEGDPCTGGAECNDVCDEKRESCRAPDGTGCSDDGNPCTDDACDSGQCRHRDNEAPCDDGLFCNGTDQCDDGECGGHSGDPCSADGGAADACRSVCDEVAKQCLVDEGCPDDGNPCTDFVCDALGACAHVPNAAPCDDGIFCNGADVCAAGACTHLGDPCADGAECANVCSEIARGCTAPFGTSCSDDGIPCTDDVCSGGACIHTPADARCDLGDCVRSACAPDAPDADANGCTGVSVGEGEPCTDDGFACTDDVCTTGACLHVPIASRCVPPGECTSATCAPTDAEANPSGCVIGIARAEGEACAEDGVPCTEDVCLGQACVHEPVPSFETCTPVTLAFRQALALESLVRGLMRSVSLVVAPATAGTEGVVGGRMLSRLEPVVGAMTTAAGTLSGKTALATSEPLAGGLPKTTAQLRAAEALTAVRPAPREVRRFLDLIRKARKRRELAAEPAAALRRDARLLLKGTRQLKRELRRLKRVSQAFVR